MVPFKNKEGYQVLEPSQCREMIEIYFCSCKTILHDYIQWLHIASLYHNELNELKYNL